MPLYADERISEVESDDLGSNADLAACCVSGQVT